MKNCIFPLNQVNALSVDEFIVRVGISHRGGRRFSAYQCLALDDQF